MPWSNDMPRDSKELHESEIAEYRRQEYSLMNPPPLRDHKRGGYKHDAEEGDRQSADRHYVKENLIAMREANDIIKQRDKDEWLAETNTTRENKEARKDRRSNEVQDKDFASRNGPDPNEASIRDRMPAWERQAGNRSAGWTDKGRSHKP